MRKVEGSEDSSFSLPPSLARTPVLAFELFELSKLQWSRRFGTKNFYSESARVANNWMARHAKHPLRIWKIPALRKIRWNLCSHSAQQRRKKTPELSGFKLKWWGHATRVPRYFLVSVQLTQIPARQTTERSKSGAYPKVSPLTSSLKSETFSSRGILTGCWGSSPEGPFKGDEAAGGNRHTHAFEETLHPSTA